jgi:acetyl-CoA carboxylase biotin carboxyl carrier protein
MEIKDIKALAKILNESGLTALEVCTGDTKIRLEKTSSGPSPLPAPPVIAAADVSPETEPSSPAPGAVALDFNNIIEVKSPLVGVFYSAQSPESDPFVSIGSRVKKGDVLCIVETMKVMNEITSEHDGEIVDICIKNGDIAEFGQVLFKLF